MDRAARLRQYREQAARYDRLIAAEDYPGNLLPALRGIRDPRGAAILELGAGTGRFARLVGPFARRYLAFDLVPEMLAIARQRQPAARLPGLFAAADHRQLPAAARSADLVIAGWTLCHLVKWHWESWRAELGAVLSELSRVLVPGGKVIIIETLGTGVPAAERADPKLAAYYQHLETAAGFRHAAIRTDYRFDAATDGRETMDFFFGDGFTARALERGGAVRDGETLLVTEHTGLWWR